MESPDCFALCGGSMPVCCCLCSLILSPVCLDWWLNEYLISVYGGGDMAWTDLKTSARVEKSSNMKLFT